MLLGTPPRGRTRDSRKKARPAEFEDPSDASPAASPQAPPPPANARSDDGYVSLSSSSDTESDSEDSGSDSTDSDDVECLPPVEDPTLKVATERYTTVRAKGAVLSSLVSGTGYAAHVLRHVLEGSKPMACRQWTEATAAVQAAVRRVFVGHTASCIALLKKLQAAGQETTLLVDARYPTRYKKGGAHQGTITAAFRYREEGAGVDTYVVYDLVSFTHEKRREGRRVARGNTDLKSHHMECAGVKQILIRLCAAGVQITKLVHDQCKAVFGVVEELYGKLGWHIPDEDWDAGHHSKNIEHRLSKFGGVCRKIAPRAKKHFNWAISCCGGDPDEFRRLWQIGFDHFTGDHSRCDPPHTLADLSWKTEKAKLSRYFEMDGRTKARKEDFCSFEEFWASEAADIDHYISRSSTNILECAHSVMARVGPKWGDFYVTYECRMEIAALCVALGRGGMIRAVSQQLGLPQSTALVALAAQAMRKAKHQRLKRAKTPYRPRQPE